MRPTLADPASVRRPRQPHAGPSDALRRIDREVAKYPPDQKHSAVMAALAIAQDEHGWLPAEAMDDVARHLGMPPVAVYEVASFYAMYNLKPTGRFKLTICTNLPCALQGAAAAAQHLEAEARHRLRRDDRRRQVHAEGGRVHGRVRRCAGGARQQQADGSFMNPPQTRRAARRAVGRRRPSAMARPRLPDERPFGIPRLRSGRRAAWPDSPAATGASPTMCSAAATRR